MDILFLSVSTGGGHIKAAEALKEYVKEQYPGSRCLIVDTFRYISPLVDKFIVGGYLNMIKKIPFLYGSLYKLSENNKNIIDMTYTISCLFSYKLIPLIRNFNPSIIVCTHTLPLQMVSHLKQEKMISVPIAAIVTDFVHHPFWKLENVDALIVPHDKIKLEMIQAGIPGNIIYPYGIPISEGFLKKYDRKKFLRALGLEDKLTGLIMGGSLGIRSVYNSFEMLVKSKRGMQIIVVTGKNTTLKKRIESRFPLYCSNYSNNGNNYSNIYNNNYNQKAIRVFGYTNIIPCLMDISDFIITKPGGMTISEALVKGLPIFLTSPIPGQEERNSHFLVSSGAAIEIKPGDDPDYALANTLDNTSKLKNMKEAAKYLARPYSCYDTALLLEKLATVKH
ncbi:MAG: UDP-N-acetylglucosamine--LPS N-acetylglucosamine transferase [Firmicutes bacterium]|nr:UDP-N-acetylglucosamine--LPS N-acetylglucosamine transferase [Bacillota bacterium]